MLIRSLCDRRAGAYVRESHVDGWRVTRASAIERWGANLQDDPPVWCAWNTDRGSIALRARYDAQRSALVKAQVLRFTWWNLGSRMNITIVGITRIQKFRASGPRGPAGRIGGEIKQFKYPS